MNFVHLILQQLAVLRDDDSGYSALHVYVAGVPEPWEIGHEDEVEFYEDAGYLIVRAGPTDYWDNAGVPENVIRLRAIVATQLIV